MSKDQLAKQILSEHFKRWFKGDEEARRFALALWQAVQSWDDVIDNRDTSQVNSVVSFFAFEVERYPFYQVHCRWLKPALIQAYLSWEAANALEAQPSGDDLNKAYVLRAQIYSVFHLMAWLIDADHGVELSADVWRSYSERFQDCSGEFQNA